MNVEVLTGLDADRLIENTEFREKWRDLYDACPWSSVFQEEGFVITWYATYRSQFTPVIAVSANDEGEIVGLFTLAVAKDSGRLVVAGHNHAEYQAWLADPRYGDDFIESAIGELRKKFRDQPLTLLFALPTIPIEWTKPGNRWGDHCYVRTLKRGLMTVGDGSAFKDTLRKKKQNKVNRLKRMGQLRFDQIQDAEGFEALIDDILSHQAFRLRAVYNLPEVEQDPLKKSFLINLMRLPGALHTTVLRLDDKLVSAQIHVRNKDQMLLHLITHSPLYARFSPGALHLLMLGVEFAKQGIPVFDLTPGGEYKDRHATHHDEVYVIKIFHSRAHCLRYKIERKLSEAIKPILRAFNVVPAQTRNAYSTFVDHRKKWSRLKAPGLLFEIGRRLKCSLLHTEELCLYAYDLDQAHSLSDSQVMKKNHIPDLLAYRPTESWQPPVNKFMKQSLKNLEAGHHVYTRVEGGRVVQYGWLIEPQCGKPSTRNGHDLALPANSALLTDFYTHSQGQSLFRSSLCQMLRDASSVSGATQAYVCVPANNYALRRTVEEVGFAYRYSSFKRNILGKATIWLTTPLPLTDI